MALGLPGRLLLLVPLLLDRLVAVAEPAWNRNYSIDVWQVEQGLPDNTVSSIAQTPDGYLWFGTFNGLVRFDGVRFKLFDTRTPGLESERVLRLFVDGQGRLWVSMEQGQLARYAHGRFTSFSREDGWPMEPCVGRGMGMEHSGSMLFLTVGGHLLQFDGRRFLPLSVDLSGGASIGFVVDANGRRSWVRQGNRLRLLESGQWTDFDCAKAGQLSKLGAMTRSREGGIWVFDQTRLLRFRENHGDVETIEYPPVKGPACLEEDSTGQMWIGTWGDGLVRLARDGSYMKLRLTEGLADEAIRLIFEDREGNLWIGTNGDGLARLKPKVFSSFERRRDFPAPYPIPLSVAEDTAGWLWVGCLDVGVFQMRPAGGGAPLTRLETWQGKEGVGIWAALAGRSGSMWFGSYGKGLARMVTDKIQWWSLPEGLPNSWVVALYEASDGTLWVGTDGGGLSRFDGQNFKNYTTRDGLLSNQVRALTEDKSGALWIGTIGGGLNCLKDGRFSAFDREHGLPHRSVRALLVDTDDSLWIGTGRGLCLLRDGRITSFDSVPDLAEAEIAVILDDGLGYLWCGSNRGVVRVARAQLEGFARGELKRIDFTAYGKGEGLASVQISAGQPAGLRGRDGRLWFATANGLSVVDPHVLHVNDVKPSVAIEDVLIDGRVAAPDPESGMVGIPPGRRRVEIRYAGLSLTSPERVRFRRKVEGFDHEWQDAGTERMASYSGLPPGGYRFRVIAANNDGVWNTEGASLSFVVRPTPWQTWWVRLLLFLVLAGGIVLAIRRRFRVLQERSLAQQAFSRGLIDSQEHERARIARELHDSLGQNLIILKNAAHLAREGSRDLAEAANQFDELSHLAGKAISEVRAISHALRPPELDSIGLLAAIQQLVRRVSETTPVRMTLEATEIDGKLAPDFEIHFYRAIQEGIANILKHSQATTARLEIRSAGGQLQAVLRDNGEGFDPAQISSRAGMGLASIRERVQLMGGEVLLESRPGSGTTLTLRLPVGR